ASVATVARRWSYFDIPNYALASVATFARRWSFVAFPRSGERGYLRQLPDAEIGLPGLAGTPTMKEGKHSLEGSEKNQ
ncbi:MAG: hypothetical protein NXI32_16695, partial [bacterium]|nr:hypothetical protein [bacterium]